MKALVLRTGGGIGGAEIYNLNLLKGFRKYYPEVELVFITANLNFARLIKKVGGEVTYLPVFNQEIGNKRGLLKFILVAPKYYFFYLNIIFNYRFNKKINQVFIHSLTEKIFLTPLFKLLNFKIIWLEQGPVFAFKTSKIVLNLYRLVSSLPDKIITVSENAQSDLLKNGIKKEKVICIHTGVDIEYYRPQKVNNKNYIIGFLGALVEEKGVRDFIEVGKIILKKEKNINFILLGQGKIKTKNKYFSFPGFREDIRSYIKDFDIFFFPTRHLEGLSLAITEMMAMGIPVVARDIGGNREIVITGKTGILFDKEDSYQQAEILINLLKDRRKRSKMSLNARKLMEDKFNQKIWIDKIYHLFQ